MVEDAEHDPSSAGHGITEVGAGGRARDLLPLQLQALLAGRLLLGSLLLLVALAVGFVGNDHVIFFASQPFIGNNELTNNFSVKTFTVKAVITDLAGSKFQLYCIRRKRIKCILSSKHSFSCNTSTKIHISQSVGMMGIGIY